MYDIDDGYTMDDMFLAVQAGAKLLDEKRPGWPQGINTERLNVSNTLDCVLGQVYGHFDTGLGDLGLDWVENEDEPYGFSLPLFRREEVTYAALTDAWRDEIGLRLVA
jgi:hypothetical protein